MYIRADRVAAVSERELFLETAEYAAEFVESLGTRPVRAEADADELVAALGGPLPEQGLDPRAVIASLVEQAGPGVVGTASGRYFGFVTGGAEPAAVAARRVGRGGGLVPRRWSLRALGGRLGRAAPPLEWSGSRRLLGERLPQVAERCVRLGLAFCAHPDAHRAAMSVTASYLAQSDDGRERDGIDWTPEAPRRARGFAVYAALRSLGRAGVAALVDGCCANARRFAKALDSAGAEILNDVVLNQVLVRFGDGERTREVIDRVQRDGTCWLGGTEWGGEHAMRISVSNWRSTADDVERSVASILAAAQVPA
jgi:Pyridoxal-dependent decarboxylase conserved domain